jgi:hypothetical protein
MLTYADVCNLAGFAMTFSFLSLSLSLFRRQLGHAVGNVYSGFLVSAAMWLALP